MAAVTDDQPPSVRPTAEPITAVVANRVRALRERAGLSQADLAEAMAARGIPWKRGTVVNLEKRGSQSRRTTARTAVGRDAVTLQELLVLALVLGVPPVLLIADPRTADPVPVADGMTLDAWPALLWLTGEAALTPRHEHPTRPEAADFAVHWHDVAHTMRQISKFEDIRKQLGVAEGMEDYYDNGVTNYLKVLADALNKLTERGVEVLPQMPADVREAAQRLGVELPGQGA